MENSTKIALGLTAAGVVAYLVYTNNKANMQEFNGGLTTKELSKQINAVHSTTSVDLNAITPNYGKPIEPFFQNCCGQKNFVDVLHNDYFKPQVGTFRPIEGYSNPNISGVPINIR
jgi:hypothetical protein